MILGDAYPGGAKAAPSEEKKPPSVAAGLACWGWMDSADEMQVRRSAGLLQTALNECRSIARMLSRDMSQKSVTRANLRVAHLGGQSNSSSQVS